MPAPTQRRAPAMRTTAEQRPTLAGVDRSRGHHYHTGTMVILDRMPRHSGLSSREAAPGLSGWLWPERD